MGEGIVNIFDLRDLAQQGEGLRNRSIPVETSPLVPVCSNIGCDEFLTSDTGTQCMECRTAPAIIRTTQPTYLVNPDEWD